MPFSFNFAIEDDDKIDNVLGVDANGVKKTEPTERDIKWIGAEEHFIDERHLEKIGGEFTSEKISIESDQVLNYVNTKEIVKSLEKQKYSGDLTPALKESSDLVPGVYEGGLKIWECSYDLVKYLSEKYSEDDLSSKKVLELGCGAGIPGIYCFTRGATVYFNDYNRDVIEEVTIPNVLLNVPDAGDGGQTETRFFSGDWAALDRDILSREIRDEEDKFDLIITSETIYNVDNQAKLVALFDKFVKRDGVVYVGAKVCYFGVGGGVRQFETVVKKAGMTAKTVYKVDSGVSREILEVRLKPQNE